MQRCSGSTTVSSVPHPAPAFSGESAPEEDGEVADKAVTWIVIPSNSWTVRWHLTGINQTLLSIRQSFLIAEGAVICSCIPEA